MRENELPEFMDVPRTIYGVHWILFAINMLTAGLMVIGFELYAFILCSLIAHYILKSITEKDSHLVASYYGYFYQADCYEPWPNNDNIRPDGFGNKVLM